MPRHATLDITNEGWTELTSADVTHLTFCVVGRAVWIQVSENDTPPSDNEGALVAEAGTVATYVSLQELAPGLSGTRVFGQAIGLDAQISVSHA